MNNHDQNGKSPIADALMRDLALRAYQKWRERGTSNDFGKPDWIAADADLQRDIPASALHTTHAVRSIILDEFSPRKLKTWTASQLDDWSKLLSDLLETLSELIKNAELELRQCGPGQPRQIADRFCVEQSRLRTELVKLRTEQDVYLKTCAALAREIPEFTKEEIFAHLDDV